MMKIACQESREERESFADDEKVLCVYKYCGASAKVSEGSGGWGSN